MGHQREGERAAPLLHRNQRCGGQRGRSETHDELGLGLLPEEHAGYLQLLFSSYALKAGGSVEEIKKASRDFPSGLSERLRERVYVDAVPWLAIAQQLGGTGGEDLRQHHRTGLTILFRLHFIEYAEYSRLLPLHANAAYTDHSLKLRARRKAEPTFRTPPRGFTKRPLRGRGRAAPAGFSAPRRGSWS